MHRPLIGITASDGGDRGASEVFQSPAAYSAAVARAGGLPVLLPQIPALAGDFARRCDGIVLSGGQDACLERFGRANHPQARPMTPRRQEFEFAMLAVLDALPRRPVLGICLGCQLMALHAGGDLCQHLPDVLGEAAAALHQDDRRHRVGVLAPDSVLVTGLAAEVLENLGEVPSAHHQAVRDPGQLRVVALAADATVEAVDDPARPFYLGVQWHPERGGIGPLNSGLFDRLVAACRQA